MALSCDVSKEQEVQKTFETIQKNCGNITYLVNSAGINRCVFHTCCVRITSVYKCHYYITRTISYLFRDALLLRTKPEDMVALLHTNLLGTMLTCRAALRSMLHADGAAIVNIGTEPAGSGGLV